MNPFTGTEIWELNFEVSTNLVFRLDLFDLLAKGCIFVCNKKLVS